MMRHAVENLKSISQGASTPMSSKVARASGTGEPRYCKEVAIELHMHSHHFTRRTPDWRAAVIGGCVAGVVFLALELLAMWVMGQSPWGPPRMIAAIALGRDALAQPATFAPGIMLVALVVHFALSIVFALILAVIVAPFSFDSSIGMASLVGALFGVAVYLVNFYGMTRLFPWFADARGWMSLIAHIVFGLVAADTYLRLERRETDVSGTKTTS